VPRSRAIEIFVKPMFGVNLSSTCNETVLDIPTVKAEKDYRTLLRYRGPSFPELMKRLISLDAMKDHTVIRVCRVEVPPTIFAEISRAQVDEWCSTGSSSELMQRKLRFGYISDRI
jgi:hypothetical protein